MSPIPKIQTKIKSIYSKSKKTIVFPLILVSMFVGAFGGSTVGFISSSFKILADNLTSIGYGCGTYGQSAPTYGANCAAITSSSSSSSIISSTVVNNSQSISSVSSMISSVVTSNPTLSVKVNLAANFNTTTNQMDNTFRTRNMIPASQPYNQSPFSYSGSESFASLGSIPSEAVDWVLLEVRDLNNSSVLTKAAILKQSGNVVDTNGSQSLSLNNFVPTSGYNYKIVVRHRNSIAISTNQNITFTQNTNTLVDFTKNVNVKASNQLQVGTDTSSQPVFGIRKANVTGSDSIDANDRNTGLAAQESDGIYTLNDVNLDGVVDAQDRAQLTDAPEASENI